MAAQNSNHIENQKALEQNAFSPMLLLLGNSIESVDFSGERPDIRFNYDGRCVGMEITTCYPKAFDKKNFEAKNKLCFELEEYLTSKGIYGSHLVFFRNNVLDNSRIRDIKQHICEEVYGAMTGTINKDDYNYIFNVESCLISLYGRSFVHPADYMMYFIKTQSESDIKIQIEKKKQVVLFV